MKFKSKIHTTEIDGIIEDFVWYLRDIEDTLYFKKSFGISGDKFFKRSEEEKKVLVLKYLNNFYNSSGKELLITNIDKIISKIPKY